jgi:hypothetical protein
VLFKCFAAEIIRLIRNSCHQSGEGGGGAVRRASSRLGFRWTVHTHLHTLIRNQCGYMLAVVNGVLKSAIACSCGCAAAVKPLLVPNAHLLASWRKIRSATRGFPGKLRYERFRQAAAGRTPHRGGEL